MCDLRVFPARRADGSSRIMARFSAKVDVKESIIDILTAWGQHHEERGEHLATEFATSPDVVVANSETRVIFDIRPDSRLWKDRVVEVVTRMEQLAGVELLGFYDLVADRPHHES